MSEPMVSGSLSPKRVVRFVSGRSEARIERHRSQAAMHFWLNEWLVGTVLSVRIRCRIAGIRGSLRRRAGGTFLFRYWRVLFGQLQNLSHEQRVGYLPHAGWPTGVPRKSSGRDCGSLWKVMRRHLRFRHQGDPRLCLSFNQKPKCRSYKCCWVALVVGKRNWVVPPLSQVYRPSLTHFHKTLFLSEIRVPNLTVDFG